MKVLQANSIILGTRKLCQIFPIKQKFDTMAAFLDNPNFSIWSILGMFLTVFSVKNIPNLCIIGKIHHNFMVPRMIELGCKTFMPIQTLDLQRVLCKAPNLLLSIETGLKNALK